MFLELVSAKVNFGQRFSVSDVPLICLFILSIFQRNMGGRVQRSEPDRLCCAKVSEESKTLFNGIERD